MKAVVVKLLRGFAVVWTGLAVLLIVAGMAGIWMSEGFDRVLEVFSPFNFINAGAIVVTLLPAFGARALATQLEESDALRPVAVFALAALAGLLMAYFWFAPTEWGGHPRTQRTHEGVEKRLSDEERVAASERLNSPAQPVDVKPAEEVSPPDPLGALLAEEAPPLGPAWVASSQEEAAPEPVEAAARSEPGGHRSQESDAPRPALPPIAAEPPPPSPAPTPDQGVTPRQRGRIARATFTSAVVDREPVDSIDSLPNDSSRVFFFTVFHFMEGQTLTHRWEYDGQVQSVVVFEVGGPRWRVYSFKNLRPAWLGEWTVSVVDPDGQVLETKSFRYVGAAEVAAPSEPGS